MTYKYFIGCASVEEVKTRYKTHAKALHPDRNNGRDVEFKAMANEKDTILGNLYLHIFPIGVSKPSHGNTMNGADNFTEAYRQWNKANNATKNRGGYQPPNPFWDHADQGVDFEVEFDNYGYPRFKKKTRREDARTEEQKQADRFANLENTNSLYSTVKEVYEECVRANKTAHWMLFEIFKLKGLGLDNFKHLAWLMKVGSNGGVKCDSTWQANTYQKYLECWKIKWPVDI